MSGEQLQRWPLPTQVQCINDNTCRWGSQVNAFQWSNEADEAGVILLNPANGACTLLDNRAFLCDWSSNGLLLVQHSVPTVTAVPVSAVTADGAVAASLTLHVETPPLRAQMAPDGCTAVLYQQLTSSFWLWDMCSGGVEEHQLTASPRHTQLSCVGWSSDSRRVMFAANEYMEVVSLHGQCMQVIQVPSDLCPFVWGSRVMFLGPASSPDIAASRHVQLYSVNSADSLAAPSRVSIDRSHILGGSAALSPDGCMVAVPTRHSPGWKKCGVTIISLAGSWQRHFQLPFWPRHLEWAADGASLLVTAPYSRVLLAFG